MTPVTQILQAISAGDSAAANELLPLVYEELRQLARHRLAVERPGQILQATALVHEAYLRLVGNSPESQWENRGHFFAAAAEAMRRILVDEARRRRSQKHGGGGERLPWDENLMLTLPDTDSTLDLLALDEALQEFEALDPVRARVVKVRYFAGLSLPETAAALGISLATVKRHWTFARAWLFGKIHGQDREP